MMIANSSIVNNTRIQKIILHNPIYDYEKTRLQRMIPRTSQSGQVFGRYENELWQSLNDFD